MLMKLTKGVNFINVLLAPFLVRKSFWQLFGSFFGSFLAAFWQLFGSFLAAFWQLFGSFLVGSQAQPTEFLT